MKQVVWYLYKTNGFRSALREWADRHNVDIDINGFTTFYTKNGLRFLSLQLHEDLATIFVLTWYNDVPKLQYEYIDDYILPVQPQ